MAGPDTGARRGLRPRNDAGQPTIGGIAAWVLQIGLAISYCAAAAANLAGNAEIVGLFDRIGLGDGFRYFTAATEIAGALVLLSRRYAVFGAIWLTAMMIVGVALHLFLLRVDPTPAIVFMVLTGLLVWVRRAQLAGWSRPPLSGAALPGESGGPADND